MDDYAELGKLLADGYLVRRIFSPSEIPPELVTNLDPEILHDLSNRAKSLVILRHPSAGHQIRILTSDERTIRRAKEQRCYQQEPIGTLVRAYCAALGGRSSHQRIFHADHLVVSLDGLWGWRFELGNAVGTFEVVIRLESIHRGAAEEAVDKLQHLLDCLAVSRQVGFHIQYCSITPIPRLELAYSVGSEGRWLSSVTPEEIGKIEASLSSAKARAAAAGLNQAYIENCMPSRLARLWAAAEDVFSSKPELLLMEEEIRHLLDVAKGIGSLRNDPNRLEKLEEVLRDPNRLSLKNRNRRMAEALAPIIGISVEDAYSKVRIASHLRGRHVHHISRNWEAIEASEEFLQEALLCYLAQQQKS